MSTKDIFNEKLVSEVSLALDSLDAREKRYFHNKVYRVPDRRDVIELLKQIQSLIFPEYFKSDISHLDTEDKLREVFSRLKLEISIAFAFLDEPTAIDTEKYAELIISTFPSIKEKLYYDVEAIYEGDPAARSPEEVILCYPGFYAIFIYRIAHEFYKLGIPYISRIMTEFAHEKTGIDIHAGATIGDYFFIDHGTGIVIGETTTIGNHVKIYQGVTLGAKSFEVGDDGNPIKGIKRHPDIGDGCVIYANATILGGNTRVGEGAIIGASVWVTSSVPAGSKVYYGKNTTEKG